MKKTFKDNPALKFISTPGTGPDQETPAAPPAPQQEGFEAKSRRLQLLIRPSLYKRLKEAATAKGFSINEFINISLEDHLNDGSI